MFYCANKFKLIALIVIVGFVQKIDCFHYVIDATDNYTLCDQSSLKITPLSNDPFPTSFTLTINCGGISKSFNFTQQTGIANEPAPNCYIGTRKSQSKRKFQTVFESKTYTESKNTATATLMKNEDLKGQGLSKDSYRVRVTLFYNGQQHDFIPVVQNAKKAKKFCYMYQKSVPQASQGNDFIEVPKPVGKREASRHDRLKRALNGAPLITYVELLAVVDSSVYTKYKTLYSQLNDDLLIQYLQIQYTHMINAVDLRYRLSLANDTDLRINVRLANVLIYPNASDTPWTNSTACNVPGYATYNGRQTLSASCALTSFASNFFSKSLPFEYDFAFSVVNKDLWLLSGTTVNTAMSGVVGLSYRGYICNPSFKFCIVEDIGFNGVSVVAHELGHGIGAVHDGTIPSASACPTTDNYIMTPTAGQSYNLSSVYYFSRCTINQFKTYLVAANGNITSNAQCLLNIPNMPFNFSAVVNTTLTGTLWNANDQCKLIYGSTSSYSGCINTNMCQTLFCYYSGSCYGTNGMGAVDGTPCSTTSICYRGKCTLTGSLVNGSITATNCLSFPCLNGGTCVSVARFYLCKCPANYGGANCQTKI